MTFFLQFRQWSDVGLLALRLAVAAIFWVHGRSKRGTWKMQPGPMMSGSMLGVMRLLSITEPLGALAMAVGLLTPLAAIGFGLVMLGAMYMKKRVWKTPFMAQDKMGWELDLLLFAASLALLVLGGGAYSLDHLLLGA